MNNDNTEVILHDVKKKTKSPEEGMNIQEEFAIKGNKGLTIKYYHKGNDNNEKIVIFEKDGNYVVKTTQDNKMDEKILSKKELLDLLSKDKRLNFAIDIVNKNLPGKSQSRSPFTNGERRASTNRSNRQKNGSKRGSNRSRKYSRGGSRNSRGSRNRKYNAKRSGSKKYKFSY